MHLLILTKLNRLSFDFLCFFFRLVDRILTYHRFNYSFHSIRAGMNFYLILKWYEFFYVRRLYMFSHFCDCILIWKVRWTCWALHQQILWSILLYMDNFVLFQNPFATLNQDFYQYWYLKTLALYELFILLGLLVFVILIKLIPFKYQHCLDQNLNRFF